MGVSTPLPTPLLIINGLGILVHLPDGQRQPGVEEAVSSQGLAWSKAG